MDLLSNLISAKLSRENAEVKAQQAELKKIETAKSKLLEDPKKLDDYVGKVFQQVSPSKKVATASTSGFLTDRVNAKIEEGHPMKNFGQELKERLATELANPENEGRSPKELATGITKYMLEEKDAETGMSRLEKAYQEQRLNETSRSFVPLFSGEDKTKKAPLALPGMTQYKDWKDERFKKEQELVGEEYTLGGYAKAIGESAATVSTISGTAALAGALIAAPVAGPETVVAAPVAAAVGYIAGGVGEAIAYPIRAALRKTDWGSARQFSGKLQDKLIMGAIDIGLDLATFGSAEAKLLKSVKLSTDLKSLAVAMPTAENITNASMADTIVKTEGKKAAKVAVKGKKVVVGVGVGGKEVSLEKELSKLSDEGKVKAVAHPEGIEKGIAAVGEEEEAMKWVTGEKTADSELKKVKAKVVVVSEEGKKKAAGKAKRLEEASKAVGEDLSKKVTSEVTTLKAEEVTGAKRAEQPTLFGRRASDKVPIGSTPAIDRRATVREGAVERRTAVTQAYESPGIDALEKELFGVKIAEIQKNPVAQKVIQAADKKSQVEVLMQAPERKAIDEIAMTTGKVEKEIGTGLGVKEETVGKISESNKLYSEMENYETSLVKKYFPDVPDKAIQNKDPRYMQAVKKLSEKADKDELKALEGMGERFDVLSGKEGAGVTEKLKRALDKEIPSLSMAEVMKEGKGILARKVKENLSPVDELPLWEDLVLKIEKSDKLLATDKQESLGQIENIITGLRKKSNLVKGLVALGVTSEMFNWFSPDTAEAGILSSVGKAIVSVAEKENQRLLMGAMKESGIIAEKITSPTVYHVADNMWQRGLTEGAKKVLKDLDSFAKTGKTAVWQSARTIGSQFNEILNIKEGVMNSPAVAKVSYMMAGNMNTENGLTVMGNILRAAEIKPNIKNVAKAFEHLTPLMKDQVGHDYYTKRVGDLTLELRKLVGSKSETKANEEMIKNTKQQLAIARKNIEKYKPGMEKYHREWEVTAKDAATKESSVRVFLAADDDTVKWSKYPFMKDIALSDKEKLAIGRIKRQMATYRKRLDDAGVDTKDGAFMHYTLHPKVKASMMEEIAGDSGAVPYLKNYSRSLNSRPLMPDVFSSMGHYIPDVENRLQTQGFWNSGWEKVMNATSHIEPLRVAFEALKNGDKPVENTFTNTAARVYTQFEIFKRLFLTPSAGLKHLIKVTGDMASLGVGTTLKAIPQVTKGVSWRIVENTPYLKEIAGKYFKNNATEFAKLKKALFDSAVPVQNIRYRMQQMGFENYDSYFSKLGKIVDKVNNVGGSFINFAELSDRGLSVTAGLMMAEKKGMTAEQALYGIYDTILKNNFLGREFTPAWLKNPKVKALLMFQSTPFKILDRRVTLAVKAGRSIEGMGKAISQATKTPEGRLKLKTDLGNLWRDMKNTEREMKSNIFLDSIRGEQDFYGNSAVAQLTKEIMVVGAGTIAGASVGANLWHHFFHIPFIKTSTTNATDVNLSVSPALQAALYAKEEWTKRDNADEEFLVTKVINKWLGGSGPFPDIVNKLNRISQNDIPEIYKDGKWKYLFSIPATEDKE